jgi:hypothetical protein
MTFENLVSGLPEQHRTALRWIYAHASQTMSWPKPLEDGTLLFIRPKGIYKPKWSDYALSVRESLRGDYPDREPEQLKGGGWRYEYYQESHDPKRLQREFTNRGLLACQKDRVPVGVMRQVKLRPDPRYEILGVALVTNWHDGYFVLQGLPSD